MGTTAQERGKNEKVGLLRRTGLQSVKAKHIFPAKLGCDLQNSREFSRPLAFSFFSRVVFPDLSVVRFSSETTLCSACVAY